jgi:HEAT repeat protein
MLCALLEWGSPILRAEIVIALGKIGDVFAVPYLIGCLNDGNTRVRGHAADALGEIKPNDTKTISALIGLLSDDTEITHNPERHFVLPTLGDTAWLALAKIDSPDAHMAVENYRKHHAIRFVEVRRKLKEARFPL